MKKVLLGAAVAGARPLGFAASHGTAAPSANTAAPLAAAATRN